MAKLLQIALVFLAALHLTTAAPFSTNTIIMADDSTVSEIKITDGTVVQTVGVTPAFSDANLDASGGLLGYPFLDETGPAIIYSINNAQKITQMASFTFGSTVSSFTDIMIDGNDIWMNLGTSLAYIAKNGSSVTTIVSADPPMEYAQLVGDTIFVLQNGFLLYLSPIIKSGTASLTLVEETPTFGQIFFINPTTFYAFVRGGGDITKYTYNGGSWSRAYSGGEASGPNSICAVEVGGTTYVFFSEDSGVTSRVYRLTDTGTALDNQISLVIRPAGSAPVIKLVTLVPQPTCTDGSKNQDESDVDCGGAKCSKCALDKKCTSNSDCISGVCTAGVCSPSCADGVQNQAESDIDCGGTCFDCSNGKKCTSNDDCASAYCNSTKLCDSPSCDDGAKNQDETDVDCGGDTYSTACDLGKGCIDNNDCLSNFCDTNVCSPSCTDGVKNQDETDVDCGGAACSKCADAKLCLADTDCSNGFCNAGNKCATPTCSDNAKNQDESDVDCGGAKCSKCALNKGCTTNSDCLSNLCDIEICAPSCSDGIKNQDESDVDCGGQSCTPCGNGKTCRSFDDCSSQYCNPDDKCSVESCNDGYANQDESDTDCGGLCSPCVNGKNCNKDGDCASQYCNPEGACATQSCQDGWLNQDETDVDCGGNTCASRCNLGKKCLSDTDCNSNTCSGNVCVDAPVAIPVSTPSDSPVAEPQTDAPVSDNTPVTDTPVSGTTPEAANQPVASTPSRKLVSSAFLMKVSNSVAMIFIVIFSTLLM